MLAATGWLALGLLLLALGADSLQKGGCGLALAAGVRPARVGAAALLLGSALPELAFAWHAAVQGEPELAYAVLLQRGLINLGVVLGLLHLLVALPHGARSILAAAGAVLLAASLFWWQSRNGVISRIEGLTSLCVLALLLVFAALRATRAPPALQRDLEALAATRSELWRSALRVAIGVAALLYGGRYLYESSGQLSGPGAALLPALVLSLPLLGSAWFAGWRGFPFVAVGLVLGSSLANLLLVAGLVAFTQVLTLPEPSPRLALVLLPALAALGLAALAWSGSARVKGAALLLAGLAALAVPLLGATA